MRYSDIICETNLIKNGWREIGKGAYASVYGHSDKNYVLKVFTKADTAYLDFINFTKQHSNKHFPKFGKLMEADGDHWQVRIEKLQTITSQYEKEIKIIGNIIALLKYRSYETILQMATEEEGYDGWQSFITYLDSQPAMKEAIFLLMPILKKHFNDLGNSNFMLRGNVLVFSDPVETIS